MAADNRTLKTVLGEDRIPSHWYNLAADLPAPPAPPLHPGTLQPIGPAELAPLFPMALIAQEVSQEPRIEIPDAVRDVYRLWRPTPLVPRAPARALPRYPGPDLLQIRGREPGRQPQAEHRRPAGLVQQGGGDHPDRDRDRRRPMGLGAGARRQPVRPPGRRLHGQGQLPAEALPAGADGELRRPLRRLALGRDRGRPEGSGRAPRQHRLARDRDLRGGRDGGEARGHPLRARQRAQPRAPAPDRDRPGGDPPARAGGRLPGRRGRLHGRRLELRRHRLPVPGRHAEGRPQGRGDRLRARRPARP